MPEAGGAITGLLRRLSQGDRSAQNELMPLVYDQLRRLAAYHLSRERPDHTFQATELVHEAYVRLAGQDDLGLNRGHFLAVASIQMQRVLCDHARERNARKRGGSVKPISLDETLCFAITDEQCFQIENLDEALTRFEKLDPRGARVVQMRFFGGMTYDEISAVLGLSAKTAKRDWEFAQSWLHAELSA